MGAKVKQFIDDAKAKERAKFEAKRDEHLIALGLIDEEKSGIEYSPTFEKGFSHWDEEKKQYYREVKIPVNVTDEEYAEILKYTSQTKEADIADDATLKNGAERFLGVVNTIGLIIFILGALGCIILAFDNSEGEYLLMALGVLIIGLIYWSTVKVVLNISNNLHKINSKIK